MQISPILVQGNPARWRKKLLESWQEATLPEAAQALAGQRVLLTGATSQVGVWLLRQLLKVGAEVDAVARNVPALDGMPASLHWHKADLRQEDGLAVMQELRGMPPVVVFCTPLWLLPPQLAAFAAAGVTRIVAFSSTSRHAKAHSGSAKERTLAAQLQAAEEESLAWAAENGIALTILRPTMIYGIGLDQNVCSVARVLRHARCFPVVLAANGLRQPVHVDDLASAVLTCLAQPEATAGKTYDLGGGEVLTYQEFVRRIAAQPEVGGRVVPVPFLAALLDCAGFILRKRRVIHGEVARRMRQNLVFSSHEAEQDFGYRARNFLRD